MTPLRLSDEIPLDTVLSCLQDLDGDLWLGTTAGIVRVSLAELDEFVAGRQPTVRARRYGLLDGLRTEDCTGGTQPASWRGVGNRLWFATSEGLSVFDPKQEALTKSRPEALVTAVFAGNRPLSLDAPIRIPATTDRLEIRYTALTLATANRLKFRYQLDTNGTEWIPGDPTRAAIYGRLSPGMHLFRLMASLEPEADGRLLELRLYQEPLFHQTLWFRALALSGALLLGWGIYRWRLRSVLRVELARESALHEQRLSIARDLHDHLAQYFNSLVLQLEAIQATRAEAPTSLSRASEIARRGLIESRQAVAALRMPAAGSQDLSQLARQIVDQIQKQYEREVELRIEGVPVPVPAPIASEVAAIAREALANAARHAEAASILLEVQYQTEGLLIAIHDDGRGFHEPIDRTRHFGVQGMRERSERLGARFKLQSEPGEGTMVLLMVPLHSRGGA